jgi:hypothetical protein
MLTLSQRPRILIFGLLAALGGGFYLFNALNLDERQRLDEHGISITGVVTKATISHSACSSTIIVGYLDQQSRFQVCGANRRVGDEVKVVYLPEARGTAMLARSEDSFGDSQYASGVRIGAVVGLFGFAMLLLSLVRALRGTGADRRPDQAPTSARDALAKANKLRATMRGEKE